MQYPCWTWYGNDMVHTLVPLFNVSVSVLLNLQSDYSTRHYAFQILIRPITAHRDNRVFQDKELSQRSWKEAARFEQDEAEPGRFEQCQVSDNSLRCAKNRKEKLTGKRKGQQGDQGKTICQRHGHLSRKRGLKLQHQSPQGKQGRS